MNPPERDPADTLPLQLQKWMAAYQRGERKAADCIVSSLTPMLFRYYAGLGETGAHAEDLVQDCWLRIHKARHSYLPGEPVLPWVFAIARHTRVDVYRRQGHRQSREVAIEDNPRLVVRPGAGNGTGSRIDLAELLACLPAGQREVIVMLKVTGMSLEEVARATSSTVGAVKQKAHRAYSKLRAVFDRNGHAK